MPEREFELYLSVLSRLLRLSPQQKDSIADELRDHLEERFEALVRSGIPRDDAIRQALDEFGDAAGLAVDFTAVSKKRIRRLMMRSTAAVTALVAVVAFFMADFAPVQPGGPALPGPTVASAQEDKTDAPESVSEEKPQPEEAPPEPLARISGPPLLPRELESWTQFDFVDVPLIDVAQFISRQHEYPVVVDEPAFDDMGITADIPITIRIVDPPSLIQELEKEDRSPEEREELRLTFTDRLVALHQALDWMLRPLDLSWYVEDEVLHITTIHAEVGRHIVRSYNARSLLRSGITANSLSHTVQTMTEGDWAVVDGTGGTLSLVGEVLSVRHSYQIQRQVESLLAALSRHTPWHYVAYPQRHLHQLETLEVNVEGIDFVDAPLTDVIEFMSEVRGSPIRIDARGLADEGISGDELVTLRLPGRPLSTALKLVLKPLQLTVIVQQGTLTVTTLSLAEYAAALHTVVYDVRDLEQSRIDALVEAIQNTTDPWERTEGSGGDLLTPGGGQLVVRHTDRVHDEIRELLHAQRQLLEGGGLGGVVRPSQTQVETRFYRVPTESAQDLMSTIPDLVAPETWISENGHQPTGSIRTVDVGSRVVEPPPPASNEPDEKAGSKVSSRQQRTFVKETVLIIRNSRSVHSQVDDLMHNLGLTTRGVSPTKAAPQTGGGFF